MKGVFLLTWKANDYGWVASEPSLLHGVINQLSVWLVAGIFLGSFLCLVSWVISPTPPCPHRDTTRTYECGFDPFQLSVNSFSINFFKIGILFLLFDLELVFLFPWCVILDEFLMMFTLVPFWVMGIFLLLLTIAFLFELNLHVLKDL